MNVPQGDLILGTAGHIDHGKTALVKALTGTDTDRLPEEKRRGITIDLGFARIAGGPVGISVVDVPGHERFVRNMLAGAGGFDMALLVIAADDGVMPQSREHLEILELLGIDRAIVAMTKCDLVDESWQDLVEEDIRETLKGTRLADSPIVRVSVVSGQGISQIRATLDHAAGQFRRIVRESPFRLSVDRVFVRPGQGVVVTGTVGAGSVRPGDEVEIFPGREIGRVRSLQKHGELADSATIGQRLAMNLTGIKGEMLARGAEIAQPGFLRPSRVIGVRLRPARNVVEPFRNRAEFECHVGTAQLRARLLLPPGNGEEAEETPAGLLVLSEPVATVQGRPFVLRSVSPQRTIGGGHVIQPVARIVSRRDHARWAMLRQLDADSAEDRLEAWMTLGGTARPDEPTALRELGLTASEANAAAEKLLASGRILKMGETSAQGGYERTRATIDSIRDRIVRRLARVHADNPRLTGMPLALVMARLPDLPRDLVRAVIAHESTRKAWIIRNETLRAADFTPQLTRAEIKLYDMLRQEYVTNTLTPRLIAELADATGAQATTLVELARILVAESVVEEIGAGLFLSVPACGVIRERTAAWFAGHDTLTVSELRELIGVSRKFAVPIAEWLDRIGLTRREGDLRYPTSAWHEPQPAAPCES